MMNYEPPSFFPFREAALGEAGADDKKDEPRDEEELVALAEARLLLVLLHERDLAKATAVDRAERRLGRAGRRKGNVASARSLSDRVERSLLELHRNWLAVKLDDAASVLRRNRRAALGVADSDGEDRDSALSRRLGVLQGLAPQVTSVGDEDYRVVVVCRGVKRREGRADRAAEVRLAARSGLGAHALERAPQVAVVGSERTHRDAGAAERDERAAVAFERVDEVCDVGLRALEAVGPDVLREHGARDVDRDDDVARAGYGLLHRLAPLRTRRGEEREEESDDDARRLKSGDGRLGHLERERAERLLAPRPQERPPQPRNRNKQRKDEKYWISESHSIP